MSNKNNIVVRPVSALDYRDITPSQLIVIQKSNIKLAQRLDNLPAQ
jgi:hypothetical protein